MAKRTAPFGYAKILRDITRNELAASGRHPANDQKAHRPSIVFALQFMYGLVRNPTKRFWSLADFSSSLFNPLGNFSIVETKFFVICTFSKSKNMKEVVDLLVCHTFIVPRTHCLNWDKKKFFLVRKSLNDAFECKKKGQKILVSLGIITRIDSKSVICLVKYRERPC